MLEGLRTEFPDATHHCFAYVIGDPDASAEMRWDDDGEPGGTAGRPILNVLTQRRAGDVLTVVVRYFGGVKLGAGGLVRAYSAAASAALDEAGLAEAVSYAEVTLHASYADEQNVRHLLEAEGVSLVTVDYANDVAITARVPRHKVESLHRALAERTQGRVKLI